MKKLVLILVTVFLNVFLFSCTSDNVLEEQPVITKCCGEEGDIPPPPPPGGD